MKTCKKLFSLLLVAVLLVSAIPFASFADGESAGDSVSPVTSSEGNPTPAGAPTPVGDAAAAAAPAAPVPASTDVTLTKLYVYVGSNREAEKSISLNVNNSGTSTREEFLGDQAAEKGLPLLRAAGLDATYGTGYQFEKTVYNYGEQKASVTLKTITHNHTWKAILTGATDTQHVEVCDCGVSKMVDHTWDATGAVPPTHTTVGKDADRKCTVCGYEIKGKELSKLSEHTFVNGVCACNAKQYTINYKLDGTDVSKTYIDEAGTAVLDSASKVMPLIGLDPSKYTAGSTFVNTGYVISFTATTIPTSTSYTTLVLIVDGKAETVAINPAYTKSGAVSNADASAILTAAKKSYDLTKYNYTVSANGTTINMTLNTIGKYTVNCIVNGQNYATKTDVPYYGDFNDAAAILKAANITVTQAYQKSAVTVSGNVITVDLYTEIVVKVYNNANSYSQVTMRVGQPYVNFLGTNLINNSTFGGITVKNQAGTNTYYTASQVNGGTAKVGAYDSEVTIQRNGDSCTLYFLRSDGTVLESRKLYAGDQIGTLPSYIVGNVPAVWTYNGKPISATDVYNFKTTSVNIVPYFGGISDVYVDVYTNGNVKTLQTRVKVTDLVQNGVLYLNSEVKSAISSALRNSSNKNLTYTAFFDASTWSDFIKTKNTNGAAEPIRVGDNSERQGSVYLYVMVNNVTQKATDSTNPKTGDDAKLGVAVAVLAVAVVGFGAAIVIKKKKGVQ